MRARVIVLCLMALALFSWQDVLLWDRTLHSDMRYAGIYHDGWRVMRDTLIVVGAALLWPHKREIAFWISTLYVFSVNGFVDVLYFWQQGQPVPDWMTWTCDSYHWCAWPVEWLNAENFGLSIALWSAGWAALWIGLVIFGRKRFKFSRSQSEAS